MVIPDTLQHVTVAAQSATGDYPTTLYGLATVLVMQVGKLLRDYFADLRLKETLARIEENSMQARVHAESANRKAWRGLNPGYETPDPARLVTIYGKPIPPAPGPKSDLPHEKPTKRGRE